MLILTAHIKANKVKVVKSEFPRTQMTMDKHGALILRRNRKVISRVPFKHFNDYSIRNGYNERIMVFDPDFDVNMNLVTAAFAKHNAEQLEKTIEKLGRDIKALTKIKISLLDQALQLTENESNR